ncbi:LOW QUALITY PROTEIN: serine/threonine-protein kinase/endoribonuclease IRE2-like [Daphnia carinata]|uniref:LOW QUALITY PROTEIN: serine/threonine-protein kinase/endoribonuclease IRE2-like n=1 Tax=Daphnia carinata TaxID=120202 RepID=UPI0028685791|nr:LOW QUALITY PROTEIN: serine/threonine-protein kinase/endoribonuclease IRE2-like [Daphnia carinata]
MPGQRIGAIWLDMTTPRLLLGRGQFSEVYLGKLNGNRDVAIKRMVVENQPNADYNKIPVNQPDAENNQIPENPPDPGYNQIVNQTPSTMRSNRINEALGRLDHPNVIKLLHVEEKNSIKYFALELCDTTLHQYKMGPCNEAMPNEVFVLLDMIKGLRYIHSNGFAHRNIEPKNILISKPPIRIILSDFGLSKPIDLNGSYSVSQDRALLRQRLNEDVQLRWLAPEMLDNPDDQGFSEKRGSIASDTFSMGCVFFFYLTPGLHPFGSGLHSTHMNIVNGKPVNLKYLPEEQQRFRSTIEAMITNEPAARKGLADVENDLLEVIANLNLIEPQMERPDWLM